MRCAGVQKVGPGSPIPALLLGQSARTPPSARLGLGKPDSDHSTNLTAQMVLIVAQRIAVAQWSVLDARVIPEYVEVCLVLIMHRILDL